MGGKWTTQILYEIHPFCFCDGEIATSYFGTVAGLCLTSHEEESVKKRHRAPTTRSPIAFHR